MTTKFDKFAQEELRRYLKLEGQGGVRHPTDATRGLIYSLGNMMQHLVFACMCWYFVRVAEPGVLNEYLN
jgi:hypothetical protein